MNAVVNPNLKNLGINESKLRLLYCTNSQNLECASTHYDSEEDEHILCLFSGACCSFLMDSLR